MALRQDASTGKIIDDGEAVAPPTKGGKRTIRIKVYSPFQTYFDDLAYSISGDNETGPFDILPGHRNFLTLLGACDLVIDTPQGRKSFKIARGMMHVKADQIIVFLDV